MADFELLETHRRRAVAKPSIALKRIGWVGRVEGTADLPTEVAEVISGRFEQKAGSHPVLVSISARRSLTRREVNKISAYVHSGSLPVVSAPNPRLVRDAELKQEIDEAKANLERHMRLATEALSHIRHAQAERELLSDDGTDDGAFSS